jgi:hypothetical protein
VGGERQLLAERGRAAPVKTVQDGAGLVAFEMPQAGGVVELDDAPERGREQAAVPPFGDARVGVDGAQPRLLGDLGVPDRPEVVGAERAADLAAFEEGGLQVGQHLVDARLRLLRLDLDGGRLGEEQHGSHRGEVRGDGEVDFGALLAGGGW